MPKLPITSELIRKRWMREGMLQARSKSFFDGLTGSTKDSVVFQVNNSTAGSGHTVVFDFDGNIKNRAVKGKDTAFGKGEEKLKFSDKITVERYRLVVDNGDKFDGVEIGSIDLSEHSDSREKLSDLWTRFKDQALFDSAQGVRGTATPSHIIDTGATFDYNTLVDIETTILTSSGFSTGGIRRPLKPFKLDSGEPVWFFAIDRKMGAKLRKDAAWQTIMQHADVRGNENRLIKGVIGKVGSLIVVEAPNFFGTSDGLTAGLELNESDIEISGMRQYDGLDPATALWTGQAGFDLASANLHSRGLVMGAGALQLGMGKSPDFLLQFSQDFKISSESALEVWMETRKTNLTAEVKDYDQAKVAGLDYGIVAVDVQV